MPSPRHVAAAIQDRRYLARYEPLAENEVERLILDARDTPINDRTDYQTAILIIARIVANLGEMGRRYVVADDALALVSLSGPEVAELAVFAASIHLMEPWAAHAACAYAVD